MNNWINNNNNFHETDVPTPKLKVITKISKWENYELVIMNGMKFIKGTSTNTDNQLFEFEPINTPVVLYALVELATKLKVKNHHMQRYIANEVDNDDIELIISFCKKYGMPFWCWDNFTSTTNWCINAQSSSNDIARDTIMRGIVPFANANYFHLASFVQGVYWIKNDFMRIVATKEWQDDINIKPLLSDEDISRIEKIGNSIASGNDFSSHLYLPNLNPFVTYWDNDNMCLALNCENIMHLATYYLCILQQSNNFVGGYVRQCKKCGTLFITPQSRQQFCNAPCTRQAHYQAKKRNSNK